MDYALMIPIALCLVFLIAYLVMMFYTYTYLDRQLKDTPDLKGYGLSVPIIMMASGAGMGILCGLYAYAQLNTTGVFVGSVVISSLALAFSYAGLALTALTH